MTSIRTILAATDFSAGGRAAAQRAAVQAAQLQATLRLLHIVEPDLLLALRELLAPGRDLPALVAEQARLQLDAEVQGLVASHGLRGEAVLREGPALRELCAAAADADLVVVGARGGHPVREFTLGKTAVRLARSAARPVLVVRGPADRAYERVLVPVDFSPNSRQAVLAAMALAPHASIHLLHCVHLQAEGRMKLGGASDADLARYRSRLHQEAAAQLQSLVDGLPDRQRIGATTVRDSDVRIELAGVVDRGQIDLVAIGKQGRSLVADAFLGSVTEWTLEHAACDVLVVPAAAVPSGA